MIWVLVIGIMLAYFTPYFVAKARDCKALNGIIVINLFLGWTFVGWVVALAWAASGEKSEKTVSSAQPAKSMGPDAESRPGTMMFGRR